MERLRGRHLSVLVVCAAAALTVLGLADATPILLYLAPCLLLALPLLAGRYLGEASIARLGSSRRSRTHKRLPVRPRPAAVASVRPLPRGGLLVGSALAVRPPPFAVAPR
jgi:hypothetical protein